MKLTSEDLFSFGMIDKIIKEPDLGLHTSHQEVFNSLSEDLYTEFMKLLEIPISKLLEERYEKYRKFGHFSG
jgi:acetyl-CoA carboxylase alpha subunit